MAIGRRARAPKLDEAQALAIALVTRARDASTRVAIPDGMMLRALRTGGVPPGYEHHVFTVLDKTDTATLADLAISAPSATAGSQAWRVGFSMWDTRPGRGWMAAVSSNRTRSEAVVSALEHVFGQTDPTGVPRWTLGGGMVMMLQVGHRVGHDILVPGTKPKTFTPAMNPAAAPDRATPSVARLLHQVLAVRGHGRLRALRVGSSLWDMSTKSSQSWTKPDLNSRRPGDIGGVG